MSNSINNYNSENEVRNSINANHTSPTFKPNNAVDFDSYKDQRSLENRQQVIASIIKSAEKLNW